MRRHWYYVPHTLIGRYIFEGVTRLSNIWLLLGGQGIVVVALITWLGKLWLSRILQKEKSKLQADIEKKIVALKAEHESRVHVGKIQFEREYESYEIIWAKISDVSKHLQRLSLAKEEHELFEPMCLEFSDLKAEIGELVAAKAPFIDAKVYEKAYKCTELNQKAFTLAYDHLTFLENKALEETEAEKCALAESDFGNKITELVEQHHSLGYQLSCAIKARNEKMLVV